jgi:hypothetical protein
MPNNMTLRQFIDRFNAGAFISRDVKTQCEAGWYDWFCRDTSLANKTKALAPKVKQLAGSTKVNMDTMYVFFKNNCPMSGPLYDDFRFCDLETGDVIYTVTPRCGHTGLAELWGRENGFDGPIVSGTWRDIRNYFGV